MGVDLTLMPLLSPDFWAAHDMLMLERRNDLWVEIEALPQKEIPKPVSCYVARAKDGETRYGELEDTPYGEKMKWTTAGDLMTLKDNENVKDDWKNQSIWAYLAKMPPDWPIVLYWH